MDLWPLFRKSILVTTCFSIFIILGKTTFSSTSASDNRSAPAQFDFPNSVPLNGWQLLSTHPIESKLDESSSQHRLLAGRLYEYHQSTRSLQIEMRYTVEPSGNTIGFLGRYTSISPSAIAPSLRIQRYQEGVGHYILFTHEHTAHLVSCINPRGESTVTLPQFRHNRYRYDVWSMRSLKWLVTSENIRDLRCLWVLISAPSMDTSSEDEYDMLENVWFSWQEWWRPHFPQS